MSQWSLNNLGEHYVSAVPSGAGQIGLVMDRCPLEKLVFSVTHTSDSALGSTLS
jgi:hypothetical protein